MKAAFQRKLESGAEYDYLFPQANGNEKTIKWDANVYDTLDFIPKIVYETLSHTKALSKLLKGKSVYETCNNIWDFVYHHIQYHHDKEGTEQVRSPARSWMDRVRGVDCDCYTVFVSSILTNLHIPHTYRITKYHNKDYYQHIYPIVPTTDGSYITIDAVVNKFNHEEPFTNKKDTPMNLTYLNGIDTDEEHQSLMAIIPINDLTKLPDFQDFDGLGKLKVGEVFKKIAHAANKANPAAVLLRLGVLASMKLNLFQIPKNLRYAYLTDAQVKEQNLDEHKIQKLRKIKTKLEAIFFGAGGEEKNLKKAMLTGRGNKDHSVSGADEFDMNTPLRELLSGIYDEEFTDAKEVHGLGDPATGTAIAAATTVLAAIAAVIKSVGSIKKGGGAAPAADGSTPPADNSGDDTSTPPADNTPTNTNVRKRSTALAKAGDTTPTTTDTTTTDDTVQKPTGMEAMKAWVKEHPIKTTVIGIGAVSIVAFGIFELHKHHHKKLTPALSGTSNRSRKKKRGKKHKKAAIALL